MRTLHALALIAAGVAVLGATAPLRASEMDDRIASTFKKSYVYLTYLKDDAITIESKEGVVTLAGTVAEESHKGLAKETASDLPGVTRVVNQLRVAGSASAERSDKWIAMKVKTALLFHRSVSARKTKVSVKDGVVTLTGEAASAAQKELTTEYARDVEGVKEVKNLMTVAKKPEKAGETLREKVDDASITAQVRIALLSHRSTNALKITVATKDGVVTLSGAARNAAEKDLVTKLVADIHGVKSVVNNMAIDQAKTN